MKRIYIVFALLVGIAFSAIAAIPPGAEQHLPTLRQKIGMYWKTAPLPHLMAGQVEQESSWKVRATLKTSRELGRGLGQLTITSKFNAYQDAVKYSDLKSWKWQTDPYNPANQLAYLVLTDRANFTRVKSMFVTDEDRWAATLVAYNAGMGTVLNRRALAIRKGVFNGKWFNGLDSIRLPGESKLLYGKPLGELRNEYPVRVFIRSEQYKERMQ